VSCEEIKPRELLFKLNQEIDDVDQLVVSIKRKSTGLSSIYYSTMKNSDLHFHGAFISRYAMDEAMDVDS